MINGQWVDSNSPEAAQQQRDSMAAAAPAIASRIKEQENLAEAQVDDDASAMEAKDNKEAGNKAFAFATSLANTRRPVGGGVRRGAGGNTLNAATGGLVAANAAARRSTMSKLAKAKLAADPTMIARRGALASIQALTKPPAF